MPIRLQRVRCWVGQVPSQASGRIIKVDRTVHASVRFLNWPACTRLSLLHCFRDREPKLTFQITFFQASKESSCFIGHLSTAARVADTCAPVAGTSGAGRGGSVTPSTPSDCVTVGAIGGASAKAGAGVTVGAPPTRFLLFFLRFPLPLRLWFSRNRACRAAPVGSFGRGCSGRNGTTTSSSLVLVSSLA